MVGPRFPTPWRLVYQSRGSVAWCLPSYFPCPSAFAAPRCPFPLYHIPPLAQFPYHSPHPVFIPHRAASNPIARANWILIHPRTVWCVLHGSLLSRPVVFGWFDSCWTLWGPLFLAPPPFPIPLPVPIPYQAACMLCVYSTLPLATVWRLPAAPFLVSCADCSYLFSCCLFVQCCVSSGGAMTFFISGVGFFLRTPWAASPPFPSAFPVLWFPVCSVFFFLPSSLHARTSSLHCSSGYCSPLCSCLVLSPTRGVPLGGPRPCQVGAPPSRHFPPLPLSSPLPALPP